MSGKIGKIIARLQSKITDGDFYEAQQQTRVVAARYVKSQSWNDAIDILYNVASSLLKAGQGGSGGDLGLMMVDVMKQGEVKVDEESRKKVVSLLREFDSGEPVRKRFINEAIAWSGKFSPYSAGDPDLHHVAGILYAEEHEAYEAEKHLVLGTKDSPEALARLEYEWYTTDAPHTAALYCARAIFPYLLLGNVRDANRSYRLFTSRLADSNPNLSKTEVNGNSLYLRVFPSLPLLNFLGELLLALQKGQGDLFRMLKNHYQAHIKEVGTWDEALESVAEMYFGIQRPRQGNPMFDMLGSMLGGGGFGGGFGGGGGNKKPAAKRIESNLPSEGLD